MYRNCIWVIKLPKKFWPFGKELQIFTWIQSLSSECISIFFCSILGRFQNHAMKNLMVTLKKCLFLKTYLLKWNGMLEINVTLTKAFKKPNVLKLGISNFGTTIIRKIISFINNYSKGPNNSIYAFI